MTSQLKAALEEKMRAIHNRFHGRYETHAKVARHSRWNNQELENVQIEDEWLMYQEIFDLFQPEIERLVVEGRIDEHNLVFTKTGELGDGEFAEWSLERLEELGANNALD